MNRLARKAVIAFGLLLVAAVATWFAGARLVTWRANQLIEARRHSDALGLLDLSRSLGLDGADIRLQLARVHRRLGNVQRAADDLEQALRLGGESRMLEREQQLLDLKLGRYPQQIEVWRELSNTAGSDGPEICEAFVYFRLARFETTDALAILDAWQADYPDDAQPRYLRGRIFEVLERTNEAIQQFQEAAELSPSRDDVLYDLAVLLTKQLAYTEAAQVLSRCVAANPNNLDARVLQARVLRKSGQAQAAHEILAVLVRDEPQFAAALGELGALQLSQGKVDAAVETLQRAVALEPVDREMRYVYAQALQRAGHAERAAQEHAFVKEAMAAAEELPKLLADLADEPGDTLLRYRVAMINWKYQSRDIGLRWFQDLLAIDPNHAPTHRVLAEHFTERGNLERAEFHRRYLQGAGQPVGNDAEEQP